MRGNSRNRVLGLVLALLLISMDNGFAREPISFDSIADQFTRFDLDGDGTIEINRLVRMSELSKGDFNRDERLLIVLVEKRLLKKTDAEKDDALLARLHEYNTTLQKEGWAPVFVSADVYKGESHQDGRTLLAIRRFFQAIHNAFPEMGGAVLVGSFPEAMLVRRWAWKHSSRQATFDGVTYNKKGGPQATFLAMDPELISHRSDVVLCDLDGNWEDLYVQPKTKLDLIKFMPNDPDAEAWPVDEKPIDTKNFTITQKSYEDFFFIDDAIYEILIRASNRLMIRCSYEMRLPETNADDRKNANPLAMPEIMVSRINPLHVAVTQPAKNLDENGKPRTVAKSTQSPNAAFQRDPALEKQLLIEYLDRNLAHRKGNKPKNANRVALLTTDLHTPSKRYFSSVAKDLGKTVEFKNATAVDFVRFMKTPAIIKGVSAHSTPTISVLMKGYKQTDLELETGSGIWFWKPSGEEYIPSYDYKSVRDRIHFSLLRTLWANKKLESSGGCFYVHGGCQAISPLRAADHPYHSEKYGGHTQIAEDLLFYGNGLALIGRAKVFYDVPSGFGDVFGAGKGCFGDVLKKYFELDSQDKKLGRTVASRNKTYFWSIIGDWTLKATYPSHTQTDTVPH